MSEPNKNIPAAFRTVWSVQPLSYVYYLVLWGVPIHRTEEILRNLLPGRSGDGLTSIIFKVRAYITMRRSDNSKPGWMQKSFIKRMDSASKLPVSSNISRFKEEGKGFKPSVVNGPRTKKPIIAPNMDGPVTSSTPDEPESPFKQQKLVRPLDVGNQQETEIAKEPGATIPPSSGRTTRHEPFLPKEAKLASEEDHKKFVAAQRASPMLPLHEFLSSGPSVIEEVKDLVIFARGLGATEVEYKGVKIKF